MSKERSAHHAYTLDSACRLVAAALASIGLIARLLPLLDHGGRLLRQFPTEDGYLMLTIARNIALGQGMSTAEGMLSTNGTQPLATLLWAAAYWLVDGDKVEGVRLVLLLEVVIAVLSAGLLYRLGLQLLRARPEARAASALGATAWFASPTVVAHSMNCLETGLYGLTLLGVFHVLFGAQRRVDSARYWGSVGAALGVGFWARNDIVLLAVALAVVHLAWGLGTSRAPLGVRFLQLSVAAVVMSAIASPWLAFNVVNFGHPMPISGQSEALDAAFAVNLPRVMPNLLEALLMLVPVPHGLESRGELSFAFALVIGALLWRALSELRALRDDALDALRLLSVFAVLLVSFYGLFFGAGHFLSRYFFALSPLVAVFWGALAWVVLGQLAQRERHLAPIAAMGLVLSPLPFLLRNYLHGDTHQHFQVVSWVRRHVRDNEWIGAIQSGTVGYFHDRTINLDGKVNPYALAARRDGRVAEYVAASPILYLADWYGISKWSELPSIAGCFVTAVAEETQNLAVLQRRDRNEAKGEQSSRKRAD